MPEVCPEALGQCGWVVEMRIVLGPEVQGRRQQRRNMCAGEMEEVTDNWMMLLLVQGPRQVKCVPGI